jgi:hypothetical protein
VAEHVKVYSCCCVKRIYLSVKKRKENAQSKYVGLPRKNAAIFGCYIFSGEIN